MEGESPNSTFCRSRLHDEFVKDNALARSQRQGLAVPRAGGRSYVTGSILGWNRSHLTYIPDGC